MNAATASGMRFVVTSLVLAGLLWSAPARADEEPPPSNFETRPLAVYVQLGLGTPLGWAGIEAERTFGRNLALAAGVGEGFSGPQVAFMPRLRLNVSPREAFVLGAGGSFGRYQSMNFCLNECGYTNDPKGNVGWANFEGGLEVRSSAGLAVRLFAGFGLPVLDYQTCAPGPYGCGKHDDSLLYFGAGLGSAF